MGSKSFDARPMPSDAVRSKSSIFNIIASEKYIKYCAENKEVQDHWRQPELVAWVDGFNEKIPILTSNINVGDFFNHGSHAIQVSIVTHKLTIVGARDVLGKQSIHPNGDVLEYQIESNRGGFFYKQEHKDMTSGWFVWLPQPLQLLLIGMDQESQDLAEISMEIIKGINHD